MRTQYTEHVIGAPAIESAADVPEQETPPAVEVERDDPLKLPATKGRKTEQQTEQEGSR